jgi:hypothetical protein
MMKGLRQIYLVQDKDKWRALMNIVINLKFHKMRIVS